MGAVIPMAQIPWEFDQLLHIAGNPSEVLEVGVWFGGTLRQWLRVAEFVVAVDDKMVGEKDWLAWADDEDANLTLIPGDSHDGRTVACVRSFGPYDVVFIDADHTYEAVKADWENYGPMVKKGGIVAFHDILPRDDYGVSQLWAEVKQGRRTIEIVSVEPSEWADDPHCGIGVVFL